MVKLRIVWKRSLSRLFLLIAASVMFTKVVLDVYLLSLQASIMDGHFKYNFFQYSNNSMKARLTAYINSSVGDIIDVRQSRQLGGAKSFRVINWTERSLVNTSGKWRYMLFEPVITNQEYQVMLSLLTTFFHISQTFNLTFMLYGGSLLGAYRHLGIIPWDDDIDVMMNASQRTDIQKALSSMEGFQLFSPNEIQWKFYKSPVPTPMFRHYKWPYIDIFFFEENSTHIWDDKPIYSRLYCYKKSEVFPLHFRLFEDLLLPVPCNMESVLRQTYNVDLCVNTAYSHKDEGTTSRKQMSLPCKRIFRFFPFVERTVDANGMIEELHFNGEILLGLQTSKYC